MKYLVRFNESASDNVREFCNDNLVTLVDSGFEIFTEQLPNYSIRVFLSNDFKRKFKYVDIQEEFVQFLQMLTNRYEVLNNELYFHLYNSRGVRLDIDNMLADDNLFPAEDIINISFVI
jgi:hypothetical protein